ncbi:MAG: hypothetical protein EBX36_03005 [Planctomycetia bacterium]|nr:hypothetical protein [Planctomycetia bacterium]
MLWAWIVVLFVVFCLPSQRSGRYLLEAMPAVAAVMALRWHHVGRNAFMITHAAAVFVAACTAWVSLQLCLDIGFDALEWWHWLLCISVVIAGVFGFVSRGWTVMLSAPVALGVFLCISSFLAVFNAPRGVFDPKAVEAARGHVVWVPENFRSTAEFDRFLLPGAQVRGYPEDQQPPADQVAWLERIHGRKTGALFSACLELGGLSVGADREQLAMLAAFGQAFGLAFQIADDILDAEGTEAAVGKRVGKDVERGKLTFPAVIGLEASRERAAALAGEAAAAVAAMGPAADPLALLAHWIVQRNH